MSFHPINWAVDGLQNSAEILTNIAKTLAPVDRLITGAAYIIGISFAFKAIHTLKEYGESRTMMSGSRNMKEPVIYFMVSAILIYLPTAFKIILTTSFGYGTVLAYGPISSGDSAIETLFGAGSVIGGPLTMIIQTIGLVAFVRGWILIARSASQGQQPGGMGKGLMHIFGGILAMNIVGTLEILDNTLYGTS